MVNKLLKLSGIMLVVLSLLLIPLLFIYEYGESEQVQGVISWLILLFKLLVILPPIPVVVWNRINHLIDNKACVVFTFYTLFMCWLLFLR
ncbi:hypothetical protein TUMSATVNIG3_47770 [Vibrio nigripulchritudo]|nr:hypothetical protein TUMSATVNIG2_47130 [Vibrio nigripulchritudo]BDU45979.1 hypothetical protein TUMSATVNIG3_47770 [Vibrio nigripulchritudo]